MRTWLSAGCLPLSDIHSAVVFCIWIVCTHVEVHQAAGQEGEEAAMQVSDDVRRPDRAVVSAATVLPFFLSLQIPFPPFSFFFESFMAS